MSFTWEAPFYGINLPKLCLIWFSIPFAASNHHRFTLSLIICLGFLKNALNVCTASTNATLAERCLAVFYAFSYPNPAATYPPIFACPRPNNEEIKGFHLSWWRGLAAQYRKGYCYIPVPTGSLSYSILESLFFILLKENWIIFAAFIVTGTAKRKRTYWKDHDTVFQTFCHTPKLTENVDFVDRSQSLSAKILSHFGGSLWKRVWITQEWLHGSYWKSIARYNRNVRHSSSYLPPSRKDPCKNIDLFLPKVSILSKKSYAFNLFSLIVRSALDDTQFSHRPTNVTFTFSCWRRGKS